MKKNRKLNKNHFEVQGLEMDKKTLLEERAKMLAQIEFLGLKEAEGKIENKIYFQRLFLKALFIIIIFIVVLAVELLLGADIDKAALPALGLSVLANFKDLL